MHRDSLLQRSINAGIDQNNQRNTSSSSSRLPLSSSANSHSGLHSHSQQQHRNMATLSPSKAPTSFGYAPTPINQEHSPLRAALIPRSVLPETGCSGPIHGSSHTASTSTMLAFNALDSDNKCDNTLLLPTNDSHQGSYREIVSADGTLAYDTFESTRTTAQGSSKTSLNVNTERETLQYGTVKAASPRKPLPEEWLLTARSPTSTTTQRSKAHISTKSSIRGSPVEHKTVRLSRSSLDINKAHADGATFLTKEALDAVNANIAPPTLRLSPSRIQRSPAKVPWNSPAVSPRVESQRQSIGSSTKPSPTRTKPPTIHTIADHHRAPSSIASTSAASYHTAHGSPVRSLALSQTSFSSAEDHNEYTHHEFLNALTNINAEQIEGNKCKPRLSPFRATTSLRTRQSRPELSINIPPPESASDIDRASALTLPSTTSSTGASMSQDNSPVSPSRSSRIPRMSMSKGSSAHAPTLSSTLKQTKSAQALQSSKITNRKTEFDRMALPKAAGTKSLRHVRTVDSSGSTPILSDRKAHDASKTTDIANAAIALIKNTIELSDVNPQTPCMQNPAFISPQALEPAHEICASSPTSRVTSTSTVKAPKALHDPASTDLAVLYSRKKVVNSGNVHSSDADDEYDDCAASTSVAGNDPSGTSPVRGRSSQYNPSVRRATVSEVSMQSSLASDLRATAAEFVPSRRDTPTENNVNDKHSQDPFLPDMYALDGYGIPWFYHMYTVPWLFPPLYTKARSKSPKKFRHKKQRSSIMSPIEHQQTKQDVLPSVELQTPACTADTSSHQSGGTIEGITTPQNLTSTTKSCNTSVTGSKLEQQTFDGPFSTQFDMINRQAALRSGTDTIQSPQVDLTTIRNVATERPLQRVHAQDYSTVPSRRQHHHHGGNGLYGGRGNVGVPLCATVPFPDPVPPMGRRFEHQDGISKTCVDYMAGAKGCGMIDIEKAAEHGGELACNTCDPDH